eukprot:5847695-Prymnesium_polylepis.1
MWCLRFDACSLKAAMATAVPYAFLRSRARAHTRRRRRALARLRPGIARKTWSSEPALTAR